MSHQQHIRHIPIFIPHMGCSHQCVFCDQRTISGQHHANIENVRAQIDQALATIRNRRQTTVEIAYFGGSFTAIPHERMHALLSVAQEYVDCGKVDGIRFSTRPDAVEDALLDALRPYRIAAIELGLQSLSDPVLLATERGHTAAVAEDACRRIVARGYTLTGQMMLGLPQSDAHSELESARRICAFGATEARIYPTIVLQGTQLAAMMQRKEYLPLTLEQAVQRAADVLDILDQNHVRCLRIGLCENDGLRDGHVVGGPHHPALGELVRARQYFVRMCRLLRDSCIPLQGKTVKFSVASGCLSQAMGQHRSNVHALCQEYGIARVLVQERADINRPHVQLEEIL